jgi:hypothetical protein
VNNGDLRDQIARLEAEIEQLAKTLRRSFLSSRLADQKLSLVDLAAANFAVANDHFRTHSPVAAASGATHFTPSCPPGSLNFSETLSNEIISPKYLPETAMRAQSE